MLIFIDRKAPAVARQALSHWGEVVVFDAPGIAYDAVSGHPDVFIFQYPGGLIVAPNIPARYLEILDRHNIAYQKGIMPVGAKYPATAIYNALYTPYGVLHNAKVSDDLIKEKATKFIHCRQAYTRCTTFLAGELFLTSDRGIEHTLLQQSLNVQFVHPQNIVLQGFKCGFIGGTCGLWQKKVYFCGSLYGLQHAELIREQLHHNGFEIIELYQGPLMDVGGILFIQEKQIDQKIMA